MSASLTAAKPSATAASATATATVTVTLRKSSICGSRDAPGSRTATRLDNAFAAAASMPTLTRRARDTIVPRPRPGYNMAFFAWPMTWVIPLWVTGVNGPPVAINARPSVQAIRSAGVASASAGGLESGKIMGRSVCRAISLTIASVKAPAIPDVPISMVGRTWRITSARPMTFASAPSRSPALDLGGRAGIGRLIVVQPVAHIAGEQPVHVHAPKPPGGLLGGQTLADHHIANQVGDADAGDARAENDDALIPQQRSTDAHRGNRGCQRDRARALQIVIERAELAAIFFEDAACRCRAQNLPTAAGRSETASRRP